MDKQKNGFFEEESSKATIRELISQYSRQWPVFLFFLLLCIGAGYSYTRYAVPKYLATTTFLVVGDESSRASSNDLVEEAINGKREVNLNNEILLLGSANLMERAVLKNAFNITYIKKGRLLDIDIYKNAPFVLINKSLTDRTRTYVIHVKSVDLSGGKFLYDNKGVEKMYSFQWGVPFTLEGQRFALLRKAMKEIGDGEYIVRWESVERAADRILKDIKIKPFDTKSSVIEMSLKTENMQRGKDVLNALFVEFNLSDLEDRNRLSENTIQFIDDRLVNISSELKGVEGNLENYLGSNQLVDLKEQSSQSLKNSNDASKDIHELALQQGVVKMIVDYFSNPSNSSKLVPSSLGLNDNTLAMLIAQYNELQLKRERESPNLAPNSILMQDLNAQLGNIKSSMLESLNNISKNLQLQERRIQQQNIQYKNYLSSIPHNERILQEIKRKQGITEGLYLYLLQKREETAISGTSSHVPHYKQIDLAKGFGPIEPDERNIIMYSVLLGCFIAFGFIYFRELLNDKITSREDIIKRLSMPILGEINHLSKKHIQNISVLERNLGSEQFRAIRTHLSFLLKNKSNKTILITSANSNEGKSFISLNLAAVFAIPGKKVALLEFDLRKPALMQRFRVDKENGLTNYLTGQVNDLKDIAFVVNEIPTLHLFPCGTLAINPADLLLTENVSKLFDVLKENYDYIIIDSPPCELVSDPFVLGKFSDLVLYIIRQQITLKKQLDFINQAVANKTLTNVNLILNDVKNNEVNGYSGYGYEYPDLQFKKKNGKSFLKTFVKI